MKVKPSQSLRMAIRDPHATSQSLGDALRAYFAAAPKPKPLVLYTPEEYAALEGRRAKRRRKKCELCGQMKCSCHLLTTRKHFSGEFLSTEDKATRREIDLWHKEVDDYARWYEAEWIRLIAESEEPYWGTW
jgi:hypothetical protein